MAGQHETTLRVRYGEVDRMGVVHHPHYLDYFEIGRTELMRSLGRAYRDVEEEGVLLVVAEASLHFRRPAFYDDVLTVRTRLASAIGARLVFEYEIDRPSDGVRVATGSTTLASTDRGGRPIRLPDGLRALLGPPSGTPSEAPAGVEAGKPHPAGAVQGRS